MRLQTPTKTPPNTTTQENLVQLLKETLKNYWLHILLFALVSIGIVYILVTGKSNAKMDTIETSYRKEIELSKQNSKELKKKEAKLKEDYERNMKAIEKKYLKKDQKLSRKHKKEIKKMTKRMVSGDDKAIHEIAKTLGLDND